MRDEPIEIIQPGETGKITGMRNQSEYPLKVFRQWTIQDLIARWESEHAER